MRQARIKVYLVRYLVKIVTILEVSIGITGEYTQASKGVYSHEHT